MRIAAILEYDGGAYHGWQSQSHASCVQIPVEEAFSAVADEAVRVVCAGRTDAGVHAACQVAHFDAAKRRSEEQWMRGANAHLPAAITVREIREVGDDFHARRSALARRYTYVILNRPTRSALFRGLVHRHDRVLDDAAMHRAAQALVGEHDFSGFRAAGCGSRTPVRHMRSIEVRRDRELIFVRVCANAFLQHMVRNIAGALLVVGRGERGESYLGDLLALRDRTQGAPTAPPQGLYLTGVEYPERHGLRTTSEVGAHLSQLASVTEPAG